MSERDRVFVVQHRYEIDGCDETKMIGVYRSGYAAEAAVKRLQAQPGFRDRPDDFFIEEHRLDETHWEEGFITD